LHLPPQKLEEDAREDVTSDSEHQQCLVYSASQKGQLDIVRSLLDRGYDVNDRNTDRETALDVASRFGELEVARLLIERGADVDARDRYGWTPLMTALECGQLEAVRLLLDHGADVNAKNRDHNTVLHRASFNGYLEIVRALLERGADVDVRNQDGQTPRQIAIQLGRHRIVELLSDFGDHSQDITIQVRFITVQVTFDPLTILPSPLFLVPTTPLGVLQTMISLTSPQIVSQGAPTPHSKIVLPLKILAQTPVPPSRSPTPVIPAPATHFASNSTDPAAGSVSLHSGRIPAPPSGGTRPTTSSFPALSEASNPPLRPALSGGDSHQRSTDGETDRDLVRS
jgi:hypothetical protein